METKVLDGQVLSFLEDLEKNNNREWFTDHKKEFRTAEANVKEFYKALKGALSQHDSIEKMKVFRIYRDIRFSKDKTPYKTHFGGSFARAGEHLRGGYYLHIKPGGSFLALGFWEPNKEDLLRIRKEFEMDASEIEGVLQQPDFKDCWGGFVGDSVKTAPKGFDRNHPNIELIRRKQFIFVKNYTDKEVLSPQFLSQVNEAFGVARPFLDYMSEVLTTNLNGESLLD